MPTLGDNGECGPELAQDHSSPENMWYPQVTTLDYWEREGTMSK